MTPRVNFYFQTPVTTVKQNSLFEVTLLARDLRPATHYSYQGVTRSCPRGLFAAFVNVLVEDGFMKCVGVKFPDALPNQRVFRCDRGGSFFAGAFRNPAPGAPPVSEICRFTLRAGELYTPDPYVSYVNGNVAGLTRPIYDTLVFGLPPQLCDELNLPGERQLIVPEEVTFTPLTVTVTE